MASMSFHEVWMVTVALRNRCPMQKEAIWIHSSRLRRLRSMSFPAERCRQTDGIVTG